MEGVPLIPRFTDKESRDLKLEKCAEDWGSNKNSGIWSNNDNSAGDNYGSFKAGVITKLKKYMDSPEKTC